jgi:RNA polymerase sigma factor (sigma-70 family)
MQLIDLHERLKDRGRMCSALEEFGTIANEVRTASEAGDKAATDVMEAVLEAERWLLDLERYYDDVYSRNERWLLKEALTKARFDHDPVHASEELASEVFWKGWNALSGGAAAPVSEKKWFSKILQNAWASRVLKETAISRGGMKVHIEDRDITSPQYLVTTLVNEQSSDLRDRMWGAFPRQVQDILRGHGNPEDEIHHLRIGLNKIIESQLYSCFRVDNLLRARLSEDTRALIDSLPIKPSQRDIMLVNRLILQDLLPRCIAEMEDRAVRQSIEQCSTLAARLHTADPSPSEALMEAESQRLDRRKIEAARQSIANKKLAPETRHILLGELRRDESILVSRERLEAIKRAIHTLKPAHLMVFALKYIGDTDCPEGYSQDQIAQRLGCKVSKVNPLLQRARQAVLKDLARSGFKTPSGLGKDDWRTMGEWLRGEIGPATALPDPQPLVAGEEPSEPGHANGDDCDRPLESIL